MLEDEADAALLRRQGGRVLTGDRDVALVRLLEAGDDAQERRLAAPARAEQRGQRADGDRERDVVQGDEVAEALRDAADGDRHAGSPLVAKQVHETAG